MIHRATFDLIKRKHGRYASWAVWADPDVGRPKSNIGDLSVLDPDLDPSLLAKLRNDVVMLGLSCSDRPLTAAPFSNFHDSTTRGQDYKIRFAFSQTPYYGAYMTDLMKGVNALHSRDVDRLIRASPILVKEAVDRLLEEIGDMDGRSPTLIALGRDTYRAAAEHIPATAYSRLIRVTHYSARLGHEAYRTLVWAELGTCVS